MLVHEPDSSWLLATLSFSPPMMNYDRVVLISLPRSPFQRRDEGAIVCLLRMRNGLDVSSSSSDFSDTSHAVLCFAEFSLLH